MAKPIGPPPAHPHFSKAPNAVPFEVAGATLPLNKHARQKDGAPYWVLDAMGNEPGWSAAKYGVSGSILDDEIPATVVVNGTRILLRKETATAFKGKVTQYADRRVGEGTVNLPIVGDRPVVVTISQKTVGAPWNYKVVIQNARAGSSRTVYDFTRLAS